jgi:hypothetical protein
MPLFIKHNFSPFFSFCKKHKRGSLLFILPLLSISVFIINPSFATVNSANEPVITITAKNEPLKLVLEKITKTTGYKIEVTEGWDSKPVTVDIKSMTLDDSLNKIIRALGSPNNAKIDYDNKKIIRINFFETSKNINLTQNNNFSQLQTKQKETVLNIDNLPVIEDMKIDQPSAPKLGPSDIEALPPDKPGEKWVKVRSINEFESTQIQMDTQTREGILPEKPDEKGITVRPINDFESTKIQIDTFELEKSQKKVNYTDDMINKSEKP